MDNDKAINTPHYECLYIISNKFTEDEIKPIDERVQSIVTRFGGTVKYFEDWGKKKFAYPINQYHHGYYRLLEFVAATDQIMEIDRLLKLSNEVLRHIIVLKPVRSAAKIQAEKKAADRRQAEERAAVDKLKEEEEVKKPKKPVDLKDLDEKLDRILETDDLL